MYKCARPPLFCLSLDNHKITFSKKQHGVCLPFSRQRYPEISANFYTNSRGEFFSFSFSWNRINQCVGIRCKKNPQISYHETNITKKIACLFTGVIDQNVTVVFLAKKASFKALLNSGCGVPDYSVPVSGHSNKNCQLKKTLDFRMIHK